MENTTILGTDPFMDLTQLTQNNEPLYKIGLPGLLPCFILLYRTKKYETGEWDKRGDTGTGESN
jgi:hypothetical protein